MTVKDSNPHTQDDGLVKEISPSDDWIYYSRNIALVGTGGLILAASIFDFDMVRVSIRLAIFLAVFLVTHFKAKAIFNISILICESGKVVVKGALTRKAVATGSGGVLRIVKTGRNWLLGQHNIRVPLRAFPNLDQELKLKYPNVFYDRVKSN